MGRKKYFNNRAGSKQLQPQMRGYLVMFSVCGRAEREGFANAIEMLTEHSPAPEPDKGNLEQEETEASQESPAAVEDDITKELEMLKAQKSRNKNEKTVNKRFVPLATGCRGVGFIKNTEENKTETLIKIMTEVRATGTVRSRYLARMLPVSHSCKAKLEDISSTASKMLEDLFLKEECSILHFNIVCESRNNSSLNKADVHTTILSVIQKEKAHVYDDEDPEVTILLQIVQTVCCMAIVKDFEKWELYKLKKIANSALKEKQDSQNLLQASPKATSKKDTSLDDSSHLENNLEPVESNLKHEESSAGEKHRASPSEDEPTAKRRDMKDTEV
eukprot:m.119822 g.119822  ORF g.119822 m.119822 type:complete len:332 (+) comp14335_c0_seq7:454-1449(+)